MTTAVAAEMYKAAHVAAHGGRGFAVFNPHGKPVTELPVIYGFNNGGSGGWLQAVLVAEDGEELGGHICSNEAYMPADLGILDGTRPDRHEKFREKYPDGYRMEFVRRSECDAHDGLNMALESHDKRANAKLTRQGGADGA